MKKQDLKPGMVVQCRKGCLRMVCMRKKNLRLVGYDGSTLVDSMYDNLTHQYYKEYDIMMVWSVKYRLPHLDINKLGDPIWTREPVIKLTIDGKDVELSAETAENIRKQLG